MSHQTGISASEALVQSFSKGDKRWWKVEIRDNQMVEVASMKPKGTWEQDYASVADAVELKKQSYILFRMDDPKHFVFIAFSPDGSPVHDRMIYAATRESLKKRLGGGLFKEEIFASDKIELTVQNYKEHIEKRTQTGDVLTASERMMKEEALAEVETGGKRSNVHTVALALSAAAQKELTGLSQGSCNYVQLVLVLPQEVVELAKAKQGATGDSIRSLLTEQDPAFIFFKHPKFGLLFIYYCPESVPVRVRMTYSTANGAVADSGAKLAGGQPSKKLQFQKLADISEESLAAECGGGENEGADSSGASSSGGASSSKPAFAKPARPGKGGRKMIK